MKSGPSQLDEWDEEAFRDLYEKTARSLWAYIARLTPNSSVADDILQQTFLNVLESRRAPRLPPSHLKNYLFKTATNLVRDYFRDTKRYIPSEDLDPAVPPKEDDHDLRRLLFQLAPRDRKLLLLAYIQGFSHEEIAAILGYTTGSVRPLLARARDRMLGLLEQNGLYLGRKKKVE